MRESQYQSQTRQYAIDGSHLGQQLDEVQISQVLRNTYTLLAMTLAFSAFTCFLGMVMGIRFLHPVIFLVGAYGLMFLTQYLRNSVFGLVSCFAFTGFMGFSIAPTISFFLHTPGGSSIVLTALGLTAFAFLGLSAFALITRKDMSFLSNFIIVGAFVLIGAMILSFFVPMSGFQLAISAGFILFSCAVILWQTSAIIHGGETNYIMATITLFVQIYNLFMSLLHILSSFRD